MGKRRTVKQLNAALSGWKAASPETRSVKFVVYDLTERVCIEIDDGGMFVSIGAESVHEALDGACYFLDI